MAFPKRVLLGVCGSISAYKAASLARLLVKEGAEVRPILTDAASAFVTPLTMATVCKGPVYREFWKTDTGEWNNHVHLAEWADLFLIAPLSANTLHKMAYGACDNLLLAAWLSAKSKVMAAPAMDHDMWHHRMVRENIQRIKDSGVEIIEPGTGELASGLIGDGRLRESEEIIDAVHKAFSS